MYFSETIKAIVLLLICTAFWGATFPIGKHALTEVHALTLILWRFGLAAVSIGLYFLWRRTPIPKLSARQWLAAITVSMVGIGGLNICLFTGLELTNPNNGALVMALSPLMTSLIGCVDDKKLPTRAMCVSLAVSLFGVLLVLTQGDFARLLAFEFNRGDKLIVLGMLFWSLYTHFTQYISRFMPMVMYIFIGMVSAVIMTLVVLNVTHSAQPIQESLAISPSVLADLLFIGILGTVAGYFLWISGVNQLGAPKAALFFNFVPVFAAIVSLAYGQHTSALQLMGMAVVIAGLLLPQLSARRQAAAAEPCKI
ncbi:DMT family transporter [Psychrobacter aestuarii]|uniref:EamA family transporter n=1 Tax=Psychrobacter aestuarii TaxID=556327 RepID=A0ABN0VNG8_9GAMM|nr:DMT family transporter [Psychrobacter aestuarii]